MSYRIALSLLFASLFFVNTASAQNWSFDARKIGMGSPTGGETLASRMIEEENDYRAIVLPFGLIQVFRDFDRLNPSNDEFDIARTVEYAAAPLHYTIGRDSSDSKADDFLVDIANGELSRDLNDYKGFIPVNQLGLLTVNPFLPAPLLVSRIHADSGTGMAIDVGVGAVIRNWEVGFGANGIGNFIDWTDAEQTTYFQTNLLQGSDDLDESLPVPIGEVRVELPVDYRANVGYNADRWAAVAEFGRGLQGESFHGGGELRLGTIDVRGGAGYSRELWNPSAGVGLNMSDRVALDVAVYGNSANVERKRNPAIAVSLRFNRELNALSDPSTNCAVSAS